MAFRANSIKLLLNVQWDHNLWTVMWIIKIIIQYLHNWISFGKWHVVVVFVGSLISWSKDHWRVHQATKICWFGEMCQYPSPCWLWNFEIQISKTMSYSCKSLSISEFKVGMGYFICFHKSSTSCHKFCSHTPNVRRFSDPTWQVRLFVYCILSFLKVMDCCKY